MNSNRIKDNKLTIYNDNQNVHHSSIHKSITDSIYRIMSNPIIMSLDETLNDILIDEILTTNTKQSLTEYAKMTDVHSILHITFGELLTSVWYIIKQHPDTDVIKEILNAEMQDALCKCFTGRISRLLNCLNGFDERVIVSISENEQLSNLIIMIKNKYDNLEDQKNKFIEACKERQLNEDQINEWLSYLQ